MPQADLTTFETLLTYNGLEVIARWTFLDFIILPYIIFSLNVLFIFLKYSLIRMTSTFRGLLFYKIFLNFLILINLLFKNNYILLFIKHFNK